MTTVLPMVHTVTIEPNIEVYGPDARLGALADYMELAAVAGIRITKADLAEIVDSSGWTSLSVKRQLVPDAEDDPKDWADSVFALLAERAEIADSAYPFVLTASHLKLRVAKASLRSNPYFGLLAICVAHGWGVDCGINVEGVLEHVVASALDSFGISAISVGATGSNLGFVESLAVGGAHLGLKAQSDPRPRSSSAKDQGVDTLGGMVWRDGRQAGNWLFIGQVTVGKSGTWKSKLRQPEPSLWGRYLQEPLDPQRFLAVPHHIESDMLATLLSNRDGVILDRLRLCGAGNSVSAQQEVIIQAVLACPVDAS